MKRILYIAAGSTAALIVAAMLVSAWLWPVIDAVETGATPEYPQIQPHYYSTEPERIYEETLASVEAMPRWSVVDAESSSLQIEATRSAALWGVDEVTIRVEPVTEFVSHIHVRSESSSGWSPTDFGRNARNIRALFADLDQRLGAVKFDPQQSEDDREEESDEQPTVSDVGEG